MINRENYVELRLNVLSQRRVTPLELTSILAEATDRRTTRPEHKVLRAIWPLRFSGVEKVDYEIGTTTR